MKIIKPSEDLNVVLNFDTNFNTEVGKEESLDQFEKETLKSIINPIENYETTRYMHKPYTGLTEQCDIWFYFYFYNNKNPKTHEGGLDYSLEGITIRENAKMLKQSNESFFRLEFYKVPDGELPERSNRKLAFSRNLSIPLGERVLYTPINDYIYVPVFVGNNIRNTENMYLFWFQDDSAFTGTVLTGDTFYVTSRFFNSKDGSILNFGNSSKSTTELINEPNDLYYKVVIDRSDYTYQFFDMSNNRIGTTVNPIKFYEISEALGTAPPVPSPLPSVTVTPSPTLFPSITPSVTLSPTITLSMTLSPTITPSISISPSLTASVSVTPTITFTPTVTKTPNEVPTRTPTITPTISRTPTITPTITQTPSITPTISLTKTITPTVTPTPSVPPNIDTLFIYIPTL